MSHFRIAVLLAVFGFIGSSQAAEPVTLDNAVDPGPNKSDEAMATEFSLSHAVDFLDNASLHWQKKRKCFTCHTNYAYLYARPLIGDAPAHRSVRQFAEELVTERWKSKGPRWDAEVVATAAALAFNDAATTKKLHPTTRIALDRMWESQRKDGGWSWLNCDWPPMEQDDHYGVTLAAIAVGVAPDNYAETDAGKQGMAKVKKYLKDTPSDHLHQRAMTLWAAAYHDDLMSLAQKREVIESLLSLQKKDGGWAIASLGKWERSDEGEQDASTSDGYGTGFVVYVLQQAGLAKDDERIRRGIAWLKKNQRESGRWYTRSLNQDNKHFISHIGTAFAVMAIAESDAQRDAK